jgi:hypothetical protein
MSYAISQSRVGLAPPQSTPSPRADPATRLRTAPPPFHSSGPVGPAIFETSATATVMPLVRRSTLPCPLYSISLHPSPPSPALPRLAASTCPSFSSYHPGETYSLSLQPLLSSWRDVLVEPAASIRLRIQIALHRRHRRRRRFRLCDRRCRASAPPGDVVGQVPRLVHCAAAGKL